MRRRANETGIERTETGWRAFVRVKGILYSKRFPPETTQTTLRDWRAAMRVEKLAAAKTKSARAIPPGSLADDVLMIYLPAVKTMPTYAEREYHMELWVSALGGQRTRDTITSAEIRGVLQQWRLTGKTIIERTTDAKGNVIAETAKQGPLSESACNKRRSALMHFFSVMNGKSGSNPVKDVPKFREPDPEARGVPFSELKKVFAVMRDSKTKARVLVLATTGLPSSTLMRLTPEAINYAAQSITVPRRRKGRGTKTRTLPLTPDAIQAFKLLTRYEGWGTFSRDALRHSLHRACTTAGVPRMRAYDLRHSFGTAAYLASGDIRAVQALLDQSDPKLTERYTMGAVDSRMRTALTKMRKVTGRVTTKRKSA